jgi:pimeloyl-ACP methyl ester carboxylesterase
LIERSISFGLDNGLIGTLCLPQTSRHPHLGQILFNAGILPRVGPHRLNVRLARKLAKQGIASLRFDLSGLGDSARSAEAHSFEAQTVLDLQAAMDALSSATGVTQFTLLGFCSGARHSYEAAAADARIAGIVLYDGQAYATRWSRILRLRVLLREHGWVKSVGARLKRIVSSVKNRLASSASPTSNKTSELPTNEPTRQAYALHLRKLLARGMRVAVVYSGESENYNYQAQFSHAMRGLSVANLVDFAYLPDMDHNAMLLRLQTRFIDWLEHWTLSVAQTCLVANSTTATTSPPNSTANLMKKSHINQHPLSNK